jgi:CMP-N-acetylneuraminic acid synthetase
MGIHTMDPEAAQEIDEALDWIVIEELLKRRRPGAAR